jgi:hypothetical protein
MVINPQHIIFLQGGIGDFLQMLPFIDDNKKHPIRYWCVTHFKGADLFFKSIGIKLEKLYVFDTHEQQVQIMNSLPRDEMLYACPRSYYFNIDPFTPEKPLFDNGKPTVGVHVGGSSYSINVQKQFGMITKNLPLRLIESLKSDDYNLLVFGLPEELVDIQEADNVKKVCHEDASKSLAYVSQCKVVVASDSAIKTMSSMLKIPTFVWLGDYPDAPRDNGFINPYIVDKVMKDFRYKNQEEEFENGLFLSKQFIKEHL